MIQSFKNASRIIALMFCTLCCFSCDHSTAFSDICFIGDSLVARWDLQASFPTSIVENYGVSGSGITYIESLAGKFEGRTVVIIIGTNDLGIVADTDNDRVIEYANRYMSAITGLKAATVYLYCIFPRGECFNGKKLNPVIEKLNSIIKEEALSSPCNIHYIDVYDLLLYKGLLSPQYSYDGLHLNEYGYIIITNALLSSISL